MDYVGIFAKVDPDLHAAYEAAAAARGITKRMLVEIALRREIADPTAGQLQPQPALPINQEELTRRTA